MAGLNVSNGMRRSESYGAYHFSIEIDGIDCGRFRSCSGLRSETEVLSLREGGQNEFEHKLPGSNKQGTLVLRQGYAGMQLYRRLQGFLRRRERFTGSVVQLGAAGRPVFRWTFVEGWISKWEGPEFDAT